MHNHSGGSLRSRHVDGTSRGRRGLLFTRTAAATVAHLIQLIIVLLNRPSKGGWSAWRFMVLNVHRNLLVIIMDGGK